MAVIFKCKKCGGDIDANHFVIPRMGGCSISSLAYPCKECGRLHRDDGELLNTKDGSPLFLEDGKVVKRV